MNFDLTEDQEMLKALAERFTSDRYDMDRRRQYVAEANGFSAENWQLLGELGLIAALFDEEHGGLALDATGIATVFEALGRGLVVEPLIENVLLAGRLFAAGAPEALRDEWLPLLLTGSNGALRFAHAEAQRHARACCGWKPGSRMTPGPPWQWRRAALAVQQGLSCPPVQRR